MKVKDEGDDKRHDERLAYPVHYHPVLTAGSQDGVDGLGDSGYHFAASFWHARTAARSRA